MPRVYVLEVQDSDEPTLWQLATNKIVQMPSCGKLRKTLVAVSVQVTQRAQGQPEATLGLVAVQYSDFLQMALNLGDMRDIFVSVGWLTVNNAAHRSTLEVYVNAAMLVAAVLETVFSVERSPHHEVVLAATYRN